MPLREAELDSFLDDAESHLKEMEQKLDASGVWIRTCDHRDIVAGAHISRMAQTCQSLITLCRLRRAHDASVLARVLLEHSVSLTFLFSQSDTVQACHAFKLDSLTHVGLAHQQAAKHYPEQVVLDSARSQRAIRLGEDVSYQGKFKHQLADIRSRYPSGHFDWYDDLVYGNLSICAHPHAAGMDIFAPDFGGIFSIQRPSLIEETASAAVLGWAFALSSFAWISFIWGLPLVELFYSTGRNLIEAHPKIAPGILGPSALPDLPDFLPRPQPNNKSRKDKQTTRKKPTSR